MWTGLFLILLPDRQQWQADYRRREIAELALRNTASIQYQKEIEEPKHERKRLVSCGRGFEIFLAWIEGKAGPLTLLPLDKP
jgi:hypothetical protein